MMNKECTCGDKKDPACPACGKGEINLDSFHKLNPEAKPMRKKSAEQFKLSFALPPVLTQGLGGRAFNIGKAALKGGGAGALSGAITGALLAPEGQRLEGAGRGAAAMGTMGALGAGFNHGMMTGTSDLAQKYQGLTRDSFRQSTTQQRQELRDLAKEQAANAAATAAPKTASQFYAYGREAALAAFTL